MREYPHLDHLMAQTIVNAYESNTLDHLLNTCETKEQEIQNNLIITDAISVEDKNVDTVEKNEG